ncbi:hypothetical protein GCM10011512_17940 [Tersicoccus solisilvae]|uniref:Haloacid dehalogenase, type II n=1 Tax=Tersicoccus solisilvae TaxID=1882339 RepID=A0ABQ1P8N6_9MICC|nr:hypothetical protein [Tersicoccus solisilvae]GGC91291.1 hypothetical protein GCM10011512_17940 [Tersicoccus solisilvae]
MSESAGAVRSAAIDVIVFDVNETLSDMGPLGRSFAAAGADEGLAATWFAGILRDGFAAGLAGDNAGFAEIARTSAADLLAGHGVADSEDAPAWKPHPSSYAHAVQACGTPPDRMLLVAVHPWDVHGAHAAGLRTAWINRTHGTWPGYFKSADAGSRNRNRALLGHSPRSAWS